MSSETPVSGLKFSGKTKKVVHLSTRSTFQKPLEHKDSLSSHPTLHDEDSTNSKSRSKVKTFKSPTKRLHNSGKSTKEGHNSKNIGTQKHSLKTTNSLQSPSKGAHSHRSSSRSSERKLNLIGVEKKVRKLSEPVGEEWLMTHLEDEFAS